MKHLVILLIFSSLPLHGQVSGIRTPETDSTQNSITELKNQFIAISRTNDSLSKEIAYFHQKEDLYIGLFERYSTRSEAMFGIILGIVGIVLPLIAIFSWTKIKDDINQINEIQSNLEYHREEFRISQRDAYITIAETSAALYATSKTLLSEQMPPELLVMILWESCVCLSKAYRFDDSDTDTNEGFAELIDILTKEIEELDINSIDADLRGLKWINDREACLGQLLTSRTIDLQIAANKLNLALLTMSRNIDAKLNSNRTILRN